MSENNSHKPKRKIEVVKVTKAVSLKTSHLADLIKLIDENNETEKFCRASKRAKSTITVDADTANFLKNFVAQKPALRETELGKMWIASAEDRDIFDISFPPAERKRRNTGNG